MPPGLTSNLGSLVKGEVRRLFRRETLYSRLPIAKWLPQYSPECLEGDLMAGLTVGLTVIPQGIAYAAVANLPPNYGLYSAFMGCFVYMLFGSSKDITIGPTAIMAIMTHEYSGHGGPDYAILLCFLSGLIILASGVCNLGFLITFISKPVISGFTSAAAITIASSQIKGLFGLSYSSEGVIETWTKLFENIANTKWQDVTLGASCIVCLLLMRKIKDLKCIKVQLSDRLNTRIWKKLVFLTSVGRNAIVVIVAGAIAFFLDDNQPFTLTGFVEPGLPQFKPPPFSTVIDNNTCSFSCIMSDVGSGVAVIPIISILESIAIASAFAGGKTIDATQEMIALGLCNILGSFVQSMPVTGSFSRTAVNSTSGVKTPAGGATTGLLVVLALAFLTPYFKYIPKATLSAVIICAVIFMVEFHAITSIWKARPLDQLPLWGSFLTCLFWKLEFGILIGVAINLCILLYGVARPKVRVNTVKKPDVEEPSYVVVEPRSGLYFPSVDHVRGAVCKAGQVTAQGNMMVVVDCSHFTGVDFTASKGIKDLCTDFEKRHQVLVFTNVTPGVKQGLAALNENITIASTQDQLQGLLKRSVVSTTNGKSDHSNGQLYVIDPDSETHEDGVVGPQS